jgi:hypothetical protein
MFIPNIRSEVFRQGSKRFLIPDPHQGIYVFLTLKNIWPGNMIRDIHPRSRIRILVFLSIPDPGSRGQKGTGSRIRNTNYNTYIYPQQAVTVLRSPFTYPKTCHLSLINLLQLQGWIRRMRWKVGTWPGLNHSKSTTLLPSVTVWGWIEKFLFRIIRDGI